jgi:hypothetical protein
METQPRYAQVRQSVVLAVLLATLLVGGIGGYAVRASEGTGAQGSDAIRSLLIPRSAREGIEVTPFQAPAPRWTHEDDTTH